MNFAYTYDDVQILPCTEPCEILSRKNVDVSTQLSTNIRLKVPFIASPMDSVCDDVMALTMYDFGGIGFLHRFMPFEEQVMKIKRYRRTTIGGTIGIKDGLKHAKMLADVGCRVVLIDVAHGNHREVIKLIQDIKKETTGVDVIAGNVATKDGAENLCAAGADAIRVGIGGGAMCTTRIQTGVGVPMITSIQECSMAAKAYRVPVIADGGIRYPGDVAKAIAAGADTVMVGRIIAGTKETPGRIINTQDGAFKVYRGSASYESKIDRGETNHVEGEATMVPIRGKVSEVLQDYIDGLKSSMAYVNASNIKEMQQKARFCLVTQSGIREASPHGKR